MRAVSATTLVLLFVVAIIGLGGTLPTSDSLNPVAASQTLIRSTSDRAPSKEEAGTQAEKTKWSWWAGGTQLRGANIWLKRVGKDDKDIGRMVVGPPYTRDDFKALKAWGANYVNISYPGIYREEERGGRYELETPVLDELKSLVCDAGREGLWVVVSFRTGPKRNEKKVFIDDEVSPLWGDAKARKAWEHMWREAASALKSYPHVIGYDIMVEPEIPTEQAAEWDRFASRLIHAIRADPRPYGPGDKDPRIPCDDGDKNRPILCGAGDKETPILVGGTGMGGIDGLLKLKVKEIDPRRDSKVVYTVHQYKPDGYAQQMEEDGWHFDCETATSAKAPAAAYKPYSAGPDFLTQHYQKIRDWQEANRHEREGLPPVAVNEFGVVRWAGALGNPDGHEFLKRQFHELERLGLNHAVWKWDPAFCTGDDDYNFRHGQLFGTHVDVEGPTENRLAEAIKNNWLENKGTPAPASLGECVSPAKSVNPRPVAANGRLSVCGTQLCNQFGKPVQLRGMSTHGLQWYGWGACLTHGSLDALADGWGADVVRVSMYVQEGGYEEDPPSFTAQAERVVEELIKRGLYVIIDWHMLKPGDPFCNLKDAKTYFARMSKRFGDTPNIFYEIANEPNGDDRCVDGTEGRVDWARIKQYAEQVNAVIRANDPDGIIIVGTPDWSSFGVSGGSGPSEVYNNPLTGANIMYSFHFYAAEHKDNYLAALGEASARLPVFVTEWGAQKASGDGGNDFASAQRYLELMSRRKISWAYWNYSHDRRSGAVFKTGTCPNGPWAGTALKEAGAWVRERMLNPADDFPVR